MRLLIAITLYLTMTLCQCRTLEAPEDPMSDEFIEWIQSKATTWKAGRNFHRKTSMEFIKKLMGVTDMLDNDEINTEENHSRTIPQNKELPDNFDSRTEWPYCPTIGEIRDQGACGSCWAISTAEVMSDRTCITSKGEVNFHYSTEDLLSCCTTCGDGCNGGSPKKAFLYILESGSVSGGPYDSLQGCVPYEIPPCEHHINGSRPSCDDQNFQTPQCKKTCQEGYTTSYEKDVHKAIAVYVIHTAEDAKSEVALYGPISASFHVYDDFLTYKSGIYQRTPTSQHVGNHAVRILGYGEEDGVPYWLCANSWNTDWGDNGYFKILRGSNECKIESNLRSGLPKLHRYP